MPPLLTAIQTPPTIAYALTGSAMLAITLNMGPSYQKWRLTGNHRINPIGTQTQ